jgi:hypothetical protein
VVVGFSGAEVSSLEPSDGVNSEDGFGPSCRADFESFGDSSCVCLAGLLESSLVFSASILSVV